MKNRIAGIVTRKGDDGTTALAGGKRILKSDLTIVVLGELDELNSFVGLLITEIHSSEMKEMLLAVQRELFNLGAAFSSSNNEFGQHGLGRLESQIRQFDSTLPELKGFILPGGTRIASLAHVCRAITRRVERAMIHLDNEQGIKNPVIKQYMNRLSDWFFMLARVLNNEAEMPETYWNKEKA